MKRKLWTVLMDRMPMAVVAASCAREAEKIIAALREHDDLPLGQAPADIELCSPGHRAKLMRQARELGVADTFLACVRGGIFLIWLGGLSEELANDIKVKQAA